jgi:hypothetical protein
LLALDYTQGRSQANQGNGAITLQTGNGRITASGF